MELLCGTFNKEENTDFRTFDVLYQGELVSIEFLFFPDIYENQLFLDKASKFIIHLENYLPEVIHLLHSDAENNPNGWVQDYCKSHMDALTPEEFSEIFPRVAYKDIIPNFLINNFSINGITLWVDEDDQPNATIDFVINPEYSNEILAVLLDFDGKLIDITIES